jgi:hypothetical protein
LIKLPFSEATFPEETHQGKRKDELDGKTYRAPNFIYLLISRMKKR